MVVMSMMNFYKSGAAVPMCGAHTSLPEGSSYAIDKKIQNYIYIWYVWPWTLIHALCLYGVYVHRDTLSFSLYK
jgi:hypothetical protein